MNRHEAAAWKHFIEYIRAAMPALDGSVPVALICMPVGSIGTDGAISILHRRDGRILWPKDFPVSERGPLLERLAEPYRLGTVTR